MLFSLLPGLRQLRAPLSAGFVWLVVGWLVFAGQIPLPGQEVGGIFRDIYNLSSAAGAASGAAAATFAAYILGILSVRVTKAALSLGGQLRHHSPPGSAHDFEGMSPSKAGHLALQDAVLQQLEKRLATDGDLKAKLTETADMCEISGLDNLGVRRTLFTIRLQIESYVDQLEKDLKNMPLRLLGDDADRGIYGEYDRRCAEGEFRAAVALPLAVLAIVVAVRVSPWAVIVPAVLFRDAWRSKTEAADVLAASIRAGNRQISSPALDHILAGPLELRKGWIEDAAKRRYPKAMEHYAAQLAAAGDERGAWEWYEEAAKANNGPATAMGWLARTLHRGGQTVEADNWYRRAAAKGDPSVTEIERWRRVMSSGELNDLKSVLAGDHDARTRGALAVLSHGPTDDEVAEAEQWLIEASNSGDNEATRVYAARLRQSGQLSAAKAMEQDLRSSDGPEGGRK